jgi:hypothetical protein
MSNLLLTIADKAGVAAERFGDSTGQFALDAPVQPIGGL